MPHVSLASGLVHYRDTGRGPPLVLLHANPGDSRDYEAVVPTLSEHWRVLALDWPGYGGSALPAEPGNVTAPWFATVLEQFLRALALPPAVLVGNSIGGNAALRATVQSPDLVAGLVLVSPGGFTPHNAITRMFCRFMGSGWALSPRRWAGLYLKRRSMTVEAMLARAAGEQREAERLQLNRALWRSFGTAENDLRQIAVGLRIPTLLMFGAQDPAIPAHKDGRVAQACLPHAKFCVMPCGHAPFAEVPEAFLAQVLPFLDALPRADGSGAPA